MHIKNGFVLNIPSYLKPSYRISPFRTKDITKNKFNYSSNSTLIDIYITEKFIDKSGELDE